MTSNLFNVFRILGIDFTKLYPINTPTKFKTIILPDESFFSDNGKIIFADEYIQTINRIKDFAAKNFAPLNQNKIYYLHGRNNFGELRIAEYFKSKGYAIVQPEKFPFEQQLAILNSCKDFAATVGSISHNTIFLKDKANAILIPRRADLNNYQLALIQVNNLNVFYIDASLSIFKVTSEGPFCYTVSEKLRKYFGDEIKVKYTDEDFMTFLTYFRYSKIKNLQEDSKEIEYLKNILPEFITQLKTRNDLMKKFSIFIK